jgi:transcriptional regulator with XRE-family HTH domain
MKKRGISSQRKLGIELGLSSNTVNFWMQEKAFPSPPIMVKLARLAEVPREIALADLGMWANFDTEAAPIYARMAEKFAEMSGFAKQATMAGLLSFGLYSGMIEIDDDEPFNQNVETAQIGTDEFILWEIIALLSSLLFTSSLSRLCRALRTPFTFPLPA